MEIIIENVKMDCFLKLYNAFKKQIESYYVYNKTNTVDVFLVDNFLWEIKPFSGKVYITNKESNTTITIAVSDFNRIIIQ